jgi:hypothetical protein
MRALIIRKVEIFQWISKGMSTVSKTFGGSSILSSPADKKVSESLKNSGF